MAVSVSVVIASGAGGEFLFRCLDSLRPQLDGGEGGGVELIVVDRCGGETAARLERDYPTVRLERAEGGARPSVPELRRRGALLARNDVVAILEEHCTAPPGWLATLRGEFREGDAAIGGPILDDGYARVRDWVVYLMEYHNYLPPWPDGPRYALNGANVAYDRAKLLRHAETLDRGYWEVVLHPELVREGAFRAVGALGVHHTGPFDFRGERGRGERDYGAVRGDARAPQVAPGQAGTAGGLEKPRHAQDQRPARKR